MTLASALLLTTLLTGAPAGLSKLKVKLAKLTATEGQKAIAKTVGRELEAFKGCYDLGLKSTPGLKGELRFTGSLAADGEPPGDLKAAGDSSLKDDTVSSCVLARLRVAQWPKLKAPSQLAFTLEFDVAR